VKRALEKAEKSLEALKKVVTALDESIDQVVEIESHERE
jgi:hypothetical protein